MKGASTNALTKRWAESQGHLCATVQTFYGGKRHDLFGVGDSLILRPGMKPALVQNCSYGSLKAHRDDFSRPETWEVIQRLLSSGVSVSLLEWRRRKMKRGGRRMAREWWCRQQSAYAHGWGIIESWDGPHDLYGKGT